MNFARHSISSTAPITIFDAQLEPNCEIFTTTTPAGFAVYQTWPLKLLRKRELSGGTLAAAVPLHTSSLLFLLGGGRSPRYPPNKVVLWNDAIGKEVAELEFRERVRGIACRRGWLAIALRRRVVVFQVEDKITRFGEWDTNDNPRGILAFATGAFATLLAIPGRQLGHVQLLHLPPCQPPQPIGPPPSAPPPRPPPAPTKHPISVIIAHTSALTRLAVPPSGRLLATTSLRGTLVRVWDAHSGKLVREFRRGSDKAEIYGIAFRSDERELCVWSDKGTIHVFAISGGTGSSNTKSTFSPLAPFIPLPKYFDSEWSFAQYRIPTQSAHIALSSTSIRTPGRNPDVPDEERCVVGWIEAPSRESESVLEHQIVALTFTGGWYRLSLPASHDSRVSTLPPAANVGSPKSQRAPLSPGTSPPSVTSIVKKQHKRPQSSAGSVLSGRSDKGKERERDKDKEGKDCVLEEFRRFGRWDGWG